MKRSGPIKRRKPLNRVSKKRRARSAAVRGLRLRLVNEHNGRCQNCDHGPQNPWPDLPRILSKVFMHEISNGGLRDKSLDVPCALIAACNFCNQHRFTDKAVWPEARQLALLQATAPERYDLQAYLAHSSPQAPLRITQAEVDAFRATVPAP